MKSRIAKKIQEKRDAGHNLHEDRHYTPEEIAEQWHISVATVRRTFAPLDGVIRIGRHESQGKRKYVKLRIPESVLRAVYEEMARTI